MLFRQLIAREKNHCETELLCTRQASVWDESTTAPPKADPVVVFPLFDAKPLPEPMLI